MEERLQKLHQVRRLRYVREQEVAVVQYWAVQVAVVMLVHQMDVVTELTSVYVHQVVDTVVLFADLELHGEDIVDVLIWYVVV